MDQVRGYGPGTRIKVWTLDMARDIGPGTFLNQAANRNGEYRILLDSGKQIFGDQCWYETDFGIQPLTPFQMKLADGLRVFELQGVGRIRNSGYYLNKGDEIKLLGFESFAYDHGSCLFVKFSYQGGDAHYLLAREVEFPTFLELIAST